MIGGLRELAWAVAAILVAVLIAYVLVLLVPHRDASGEAILPLPVSVFDGRLNELDREALEKSYREQVEHLFIGWMKDPTGQPGRAQNGKAKARKAYIEIMTAIEQRR